MAGRGKGYKDIVMVTPGTGVGGGVIVDEKIVAGRHGLAGEIGHIHVRDGEKEACNCGGHGCLEQVASATGIAREARRSLAASDLSVGSARQAGEQVTAKGRAGRGKGGRRPWPWRSWKLWPTTWGLVLAQVGADRGSGDLCHRRRRIQGGTVSHRSDPQAL